MFESFLPEEVGHGDWYNGPRLISRRIGISLIFYIPDSKVWPIVISQILNTLDFALSSRIVSLIILPLLIVCNLLLKSCLLPRNPGPILEFKDFKDPAFTFFSFGFILLGIFKPLWYFQTFAIKLGVSPSSAFWLLAIINAGDTNDDGHEQCRLRYRVSPSPSIRADKQGFDGNTDCGDFVKCR